MEDHVVSKFVKTTKSHRCTFCGKTFPKGTRMRCDVNQYDRFKTVYVCEGCVALMDEQIPDILSEHPIIAEREKRKVEFSKSITGTTR